jgi:hypothetical protein
MSAPDIQRIVANTGEAITYKSLLSNALNTTTLERTAVYTDYTASAYIRMFLDSQLTHLIRQGDRQMILPASGLEFAPKTNDRVIDSSGDTYNVVSVDARRGFGGELSLYRIQLRQDNGDT